MPRWPNRETQMRGHYQFTKVSAPIGQGPNNLKSHTFYKCTTCGRVFDTKAKANEHKKADY